MQFRSPVSSLLAVLAALALGSASAYAQTVASALANFETEVGTYNLVALGSTATSSFSGGYDVDGGLAINGNLSLSGGSIDDHGVTAAPSLFVRGSLTLNGTTTLNGGSASIASSNSSVYSWNATQDDLYATSNASNNLNITNSGSSTDPLGAAGPGGWNWSTEISDLGADSTTLANATTNGTTVIAGTISVNSQNLLFTPNSTPAVGTTVIFTLNAADLSGNSYNGSSFSNISINVPSDVNYVINVINAAGTTLFSGANFNSGSNDSNILWNIEGSGTVTLGGGYFYGSILAPTATISNGGNTTENGQVAADAFTDTNTELHYIGYDPAAVVLPEPSTFALWGVALCGAAVLARRKLVGRKPVS